jgi:hypothetical protein
MTLLVALGTSLPGWSAPDEVQQRILQHFIESEQKLAQAEKATGEARYRLMGEHLWGMVEALGQMRAATPREGMTCEQQSEWIAEHARLMEQAMKQMIMQYGLLMQELRH